MKTIVVFIFISLLSLSVIGQEKEVKPLSFLITKDSNQKCFGNSINVIAKLTNTSNTPIVIDIQRIGYSVSYSWFTNTAEGNAGDSFNSTSDVGPKYKPAFITLKPSESYSKKVILLFDNKQFTRGRKYGIQITYGQFLRKQFENIDVWVGAVESNELNTLIKRCK